MKLIINFNFATKKVIRFMGEANLSNEMFCKESPSSAVLLVHEDNNHEILILIFAKRFAVFNIT